MVKTLPPRWHSLKHLSKSILSNQEKSWLFDHGSLTARLRQHCQQHFRVQVLFQGWQQPRRDELIALQSQRREQTVVRESLLICDDKVCIFARSVFPKSALVGKAARLHQLGARPLIEILQTDPTLQRSEIEVAQMFSSHHIKQPLTNQQLTLPVILWARRSIFYLYGQPLLVSETFLPVVFGLNRQDAKI